LCFNFSSRGAGLQFQPKRLISIQPRDAQAFHVDFRGPVRHQVS
jgi:hypothetical protein